MKRIKKRYLIPGIVLLLIAGFLFFLSDIVRYVAERKAPDLLGRKLSIGAIHINYAKVSLRIKGFVLYEADQKSRFVAFDELYVDVEPWALIRKEYSLDALRLINPEIKISQNGSRFNFDDLIPPADSLAVDTIEQEQAADSSLIRLNLRNIHIEGGKIIYEDQQLNSHIEINKLGLDVPLFSWDNRHSDIGLEFGLGSEGLVDISLALDNLAGRYNIHLKTSSIDLSIAQAYLQDVLRFGKLEGKLFTDINLHGSLEHMASINLDGKVWLDSFLLTDTGQQKVMAIQKIQTDIKQIDLDKQDFHISSLVITRPQLWTGLDEEGISLLKLFITPEKDSLTLSTEQNETPTELNEVQESDSLGAVAVKNETTTVTASADTKGTLNYSLDSLRLHDAEIQFTDYTLARPFQYLLSDFDLAVDNVHPKAGKMPVYFSLNTNNDGKIDGELTLNMTQPENLDLNLNIERLGLMNLSPYSESYVARPILKGWLNYAMQLQLKEGKLSNQNKVLIESLEMGDKVEAPQAMNVPVKLGLYLLKDSKNNISIELPVEGDINNPQFSYGKVLWNTFTALMVKVAASPFNAMADILGVDQQEVSELAFQYSQNTLIQKQMEQLDKIALLIQKKPDLMFRIVQHTDRDKELEQLALNRARQVYVQAASDSLARIQADSIPKQSLQLSDSAFMAFVRHRVPEVDSIGLPAASVRLCDAGDLSARLDSVLQLRNTQVRSYLLGIEGLNEQRFEVQTADLINLPAELRYPHFRVDVYVR